MNLQSSTLAKLSAYGLALVVVFGAAFFLGRAVDPIAAQPAGEHGMGAEFTVSIDG